MEKRRVITLNGVSVENANRLMERFVGDIKDLNGQEVWIGLNNSTTIKCIVFSGSEDEGAVIRDYGIYIFELRKDTRYAVACLTNPDVCHAIDTNALGTPFFCGEGFDALVGKWIARETDELPSSPCGLYNYVTMGLGFGSVELYESECDRLFG